MITPEDLLWRAAAWLAVIVFGGGLLYQVWWQVTLPDEEAAKLHFGWHVPGWTFGALALVAFVAALLFPGFAAGLYVVGTSLVLGLGVWCFMAIVFRKFI